MAKELLSDLANGREIPRFPISKRGGGEFYEKKSAGLLADVTESVDAPALARISRATFFPPFNMAYFNAGGQKYFIVPESEVDEKFWFGDAINEPKL